MKNFESRHFKDGGYSIGELNSETGWVDGLGFIYWADTDSLAMGQYENGSAEGICLYVKDDRAQLSFCENNKDALGITLSSKKDILGIYQSNKEGKWHGYAFQIYKTGWRYFYIGDEDSKTKMIEYHADTKKLYMFYLKLGEDPVWAKQIGKDTVKWDAGIKFGYLHQETFPKATFVAGNNCINPEDGEGPCIDHFPEDQKTIIGTINSNTKYEGVVYSDYPDYVIVEQQSNGHLDGISYRIEKDMSFFRFISENKKGAVVHVAGWPEDDSVQVRHYNYGDDEKKFDYIQITKDFDVLIGVGADEEYDKEAMESYEEFSFDKEFNSSKDEDDDEGEPVKKVKTKTPVKTKEKKTGTKKSEDDNWGKLFKFMKKGK